MSVSYKAVAMFGVEFTRKSEADKFLKSFGIEEVEEVE